MRLIKKRNKKEKFTDNSKTESKMKSDYKIDVDSESNEFSKDFKDFYYNHFVDAYGLARREVDLSFFDNMTDNEKEIAKKLVRQNLRLRQAHLFRASGLLSDQEALPILYELFDNNTDLSWLLSIGQAIWILNGDKLYVDLLRKLRNHPSDTLREAHFNQITDLKNIESIEMLIDSLNDKSRLVQSMALSQLNHLESGKFSIEPNHDKDYFLRKVEDKEFKKKLLDKLIKLNNKPST